MIKLTSKPSYHDFDIIDFNNMMLMYMRKPTIKLDKPIYCGAKILDLSKLHMYQIFYDYFKVRYGTDVTLVYQDTDSFFLDIKTVNLYEDIKDSFNEVCTAIYDTANFPKHHIAYNVKNDKVLGKMKIETGAELLTKQCSLKSKMYASEQTNTITQDVIDEREKCVVKRRKGINELVEKLGTREYVTEEEIEENSRARSAKMRVGIKL